MKKTDDVNTPMIALIGILGAVLLFVLTVGLQAWIQGYQEGEHYRKVVEPPDQQLSELDSKQLQDINTYRVIDPKKGIYAIPIDRAMDLVVEDLATTGTRAQGSEKNVAKKGE